MSAGQRWTATDIIFFLLLIRNYELQQFSAAVVNRQRSAVVLINRGLIDYLTHHQGVIVVKTAGLFTT